VYWVTLGRDVEGPAALAGRVSQLIARLDPEQQVSFTDPEQAAEHLAAVLAAGPRRLLILDDVWHADQLRAFPVAGHCARLITTRIPSVVTGSPVTVPVGEVTQEQAHAIVNFGLATPVSRDQLRALLAETGRYALLLRLVNEILSDQVATGRLVDDATAAVVVQLREAGASGVDRLTREAGRLLDIDDPAQRSRAIAATIEASLGLLAPEQRDLFAQTAVFVEDEVVSIHLVDTLWAATAGFDEAQTRALCVRLQDLALVSVDDTVPGGAIHLHDVIRDHLRASLSLDAPTHLHQSLVTAVAGTVPTAAAATPDSAASPADKVRAWWLLPESERYLYDHLIEHLVAADRAAEAEQLATDLRWVARRLQLANVNAPYTDLTRLSTVRANHLARLFAGVAHLLGPTNPPHSRFDILCSRVAHDPIWGPQTAELLAAQPGTHLLNQWDLTDLPGPSLRRTLAGHTGAVNAVAVSPDGTWLATASSDATVRLWDTATGEHRATLTHSRPVHAVAIAPDATWLATTSGDFGTVQLWDVATGKTRATLNGHEREVGAVAVSPDGSWLATAGGHDATVRLWDVATGKTRATLIGHRSEVNAVVFSSDGTWLATVETYERMVVLWDAATAKPRAAITDHGGWVEAVAISSDGMWLATGDQDGYVALWDSATGEHRTTLTRHAGMVEAMAIAPDGTWLATASYDGTTRLWDTATGETRATLTGHTDKVNAVAIAPDGTWLATASDDGMVRFWDTATGERQDILTGGTDEDAAATIPPVESQQATTGSYDETVQLWTAATDKPRTTVASAGDSKAYALDGTWLASRDAQDDGVVHIYDVPTGERRHTLTGHTDVVLIVIVAPDGTWLATATSTYDDTVRLWDATTGDIRHILSGHEGVNLVAIAPDGSWLATDSRGTIRLWDTATGEIRAVLAHKSMLMVPPDGTWLATASFSGTISLWDTATGKNCTTLVGHTAFIYTLVVSLDGSWLATASSDGTVRLWDAATGKNRATLIGHTGSVTAVAIAPDETRLATIGHDRAVRVWDAATGEAVAMMRLDRRPTKIAWSPSGDEIAVLASDYNAYLLKITH
jgi:WD40 repeat protein